MGKFTRCAGSLLLFWLFLPVLSFAQLQFEKKMELPFVAQLATADELGNFYFVTSQNEILKTDSTGRELFRNSNNRLGDINLFDARDPFHLLVYYDDFNQIQLLDRTLTPTSTIHLAEVGIFQTNALALSSDNQIWVFDDLNQRLLKLDESGATVIESDNLGQLLGQSFQPAHAVEFDNRVWLTDPSIGILVFDVFGKFLQQIPAPGVLKIISKGQYLLLFQRDQYATFNPQSMLWQPETPIPFCAHATTCLPVRNFLFVIRNGITEVYQF